MLLSFADNRTLHYCKRCDRDFRIKIADDETAELLLECPGCRWLHLRIFKNGVAVSCEISEMRDPIVVKAHK